MKLYTYFTPLTNFFIICMANNAVSSDVKYHMEMVGTVQSDLTYTRRGLKFLDSALVTVIDKKTKDSLHFYTDTVGKWTADLPLNSYFIVRVSKAGYVSKIIDVNTRVPASRLTDYTFQQEVFLFEKINEIDVSLLKYPIATVKYKHRYQGFTYNYNYVDKINQELKKLYLAYYSKHWWKRDSIAKAMRVKPKESTVVVAKPIENKVMVSGEMHPFEITATDVKFQVQVIATTRYCQLNNSFFKGVKKVTETREDGFYKYTLGDFASITEAKLLKRELRSQGFTDSFMVAIKDNKRIPIREAIALAKR